MRKDFQTELPSNHKFGLFFTFIFLVAAGYFFYSSNMTWAYGLLVAAFIFLIITLVKRDALLPLNKLWMWLGLLLGIIINPIILGIIFFGLFTPIATLMRLIGRDELRLKITPKGSYWITRSDRVKSESFKHQF